MRTTRRAQIRNPRWCESMSQPSCFNKTGGSSPAPPGIWNLQSGFCLGPQRTWSLMVWTTSCRNLVSVMLELQFLSGSNEGVWILLIKFCLCLCFA
ncbi:hypothetical protein Hamer_G006469 [Homarus americanus]|uniref:Uncharacterized protein n=1 Tax=Homarus americanus TaxID=6706 RepID=A0A8J5JHY7_HOMAM|nr:hypothetical protein Hamer_G006469 [Homarus americanus]